MTSALVLGAGGTVGMAYHAGVLRALAEASGVEPGTADLIIGTSAGSLMAAALRSGHDTDTLWRVSVGEHPTLSFDGDERSPWDGLWRTPFDVARRLVGSAYVLQRSVVRVPVPSVPRPLQRLFPGGFHSIPDGAEETIATFLQEAWPSEPTWLVTVDVRTGRRVVLGRRVPARTDLRTAVRASCAIPAFFQPVQVGRHTLVDGGIHSTSNLDLATKITPDVIVGVVPMAFERGVVPFGLDGIIRGFAQRRLAPEVEQARRSGSRVLLIRPTRHDLAAMGPNLMRRGGNDQVTRVAYESAVRQLEAPRARDVLAQVRETVRR